MSNNTKNAKQMYVSDDFFRSDDILKLGRTLNISKAEKPLNEKFTALVDEVQKLYDENQWLEMKNKDVYFEKTCNLIIPILSKTTITCGWERGFINEFAGFSGRIIKYSEFKKLFYENGSNPMALKNNYYNNRYYFKCNGYECYCMYTYNEDDNESYGYHRTFDNCSCHNYSSAESCHDSKCQSNMKVPVFDPSSKSLLDNLVKYDLVPKKLSKEGKATLQILKTLASANYISVSDNKIKALKLLKNAIINNNNIPESIKDVLKEPFSDDNMAQYMKEYVYDNIIELTDERLKFIGKPLLECDQYRAKIEPYDLKCLTDPNGGHWELWSDNEPENKTRIEFDKPLVGRNPKIDIHWDGLVGIDFGTKSTIVAYQNGTDKTYLHRVGIGELSKKATAEQYENPTIMEFIDFENFMDCYESSLGRPETKWNDIVVSHEAQGDLNSSGRSENFYSYFYNLKQWCADTTSGNQIRVKDQKGHEKILPSFISLADEDFNPIEIYAYYLGLYINNMRNGIYLDYLMSFPVTYEKGVRDKILSSFEKGLKKSLPTEILEDEEVMKSFRVQSGAYEPACYAICALQQFNIEPTDDEQVFYGIFDFGGGTTDFDFGIWRLADEDNVHEEDYDYVIEHFGAGGDQYLGGENLLELLSYEVFKANADVLLTGNPDGKDKKSVGYSFYKPLECDIFTGSEVLISNSQEAKRNTKSLMEELRKVTEHLYLGEDGEIKCDAEFLSEGHIDVTLFDKEGRMKTAVSLKLTFGDNKKLDLIQILEDRIELGVNNFFQALTNNFNKVKDLNVKNIYIFLAGNASQSPIVTKLFEKYINEYSETVFRDFARNNDNFFKIFAPLGTAEAKEIQEQNGVILDSNEINHATGKTGVAYGLLDGRKGSNILVKSEVTATQEIPFKYYIGLNRKKKFKPVMLKGAKYNEWVRLKNALTSDFYIYYSNLPMVENAETSIDDIKKKKCILTENFEDESYSIYIRPIKPNVIEYAVATEEGIANNDFILQPKSLELVI